MSQSCLYARELALEAVEEVWVGCHVSTGEDNKDLAMGKIVLNTEAIMLKGAVTCSIQSRKQRWETQ